MKYLLPLRENQFLFVMKQKQLNRIKLILTEQGRTGVWLAKKLGKDPSTVSLWCSNKTQPSLQMIDKISELLDVDRIDLINRSR